MLQEKLMTIMLANAAEHVQHEALAATSLLTPRIEGTAHDQ